MTLTSAVLLIGLGIYVQAFMILRDTTKERFLAILYATLVGYFFAGIAFLNELGSSDPIMNQPTFWGVTFITFIFFFSFVNREKILSYISEQTILIYTIVFWYAYITIVYPTLDHPYIGLFVFSIPTLFTLAQLVINKKLSYMLQGVSYLWFLFIIVFLSGIYFIEAFLKPYGNLVDIPAFQLITFGMISMYLTSQLVYIYDVLPVPEKHTPYKLTLHNAKQKLIGFNKFFLDHQLSPLHSILLTVILGGFFIINYFFNILDVYFAITIAILISSQAYSYIDRKSVV